MAATIVAITNYLGGGLDVPFNKRFRVEGHGSPLATARQYSK